MLVVMTLCHALYVTVICNVLQGNEWHIRLINAHYNYWK